MKKPIEPISFSIYDHVNTEIYALGTCTNLCRRSQLSQHVQKEVNDACVKENGCYKPEYWSVMAITNCTLLPT